MTPVAPQIFEPIMTFTVKWDRPQWRAAVLESPKKIEYNAGPFEPGPFCTLPFPFNRWSNIGDDQAAADAVNEFTRTKMREDGFYRRIMPPMAISNDELDRSVDTDEPVKIVDIRQRLADNAIMDLIAEEDNKFISSLNTVLLNETTYNDVMAWGMEEA